MLVLGVCLFAASFADAADIDYFIYDDWGGTWADAEKNRDRIETAWQDFLVKMDRLRGEQNKIIDDFEKELAFRKRKKILSKLK